MKYRSKPGVLTVRTSRLWELNITMLSKSNYIACGNRMGNLLEQNRQLRRGQECLKDTLGTYLYYLHKTGKFSSVQLLSHVRLCDPMNRSTPGLPVHHHLREFTQTHVHWVRDAIQPSHPRSSLSPSAPNPSQRQSLFQWVNSSHAVAKVLEFQLQHHSLQRNPRADLLQNGLVGSPCSPRDSQESSPTPQFKSINSSVLSLLQSPTLTSIHDHRIKHSLD